MCSTSQPRVSAALQNDTLVLVDGAVNTKPIRVPSSWPAKSCGAWPYRKAVSPSFDISSGLRSAKVNSALRSECPAIMKTTTSKYWPLISIYFLVNFAQVLVREK
jgi:hypothetical protein